MGGGRGTGEREEQERRDDSSIICLNEMTSAERKDIHNTKNYKSC